MRWGTGQPTIHMDHFFLESSPGIKNVRRDELLTLHLSKSRWSLSQLQDSLMNGQIAQSDFSWGGCGWPRHLNVPRGMEEGMQWSLVVMVSRVLPQDMVRLGNWRRNKCLTAVSGMGWFLTVGPWVSPWTETSKILRT